MFFEEEVHFDPAELTAQGKAILTGLLHAAEHTLETIAHPIDHIIMPVVTLTRDSTVLLATAAGYDDMLNYGEFIPLKDYLAAQPSIARTACENMTLRGEALKHAQEEFRDASLSKKTELAVENAFGVIFSSAATKLAIKTGKKGINYYQFKRTSNKTDPLTTTEIAAGLTLAEMVAIDAHEASSALSMPKMNPFKKTLKFATKVIEHKFLNANIESSHQASTQDTIELDTLMNDPALKKLSELLNPSITGEALRRESVDDVSEKISPEMAAAFRTAETTRELFKKIHEVGDTVNSIDEAFKKHAVEVEQNELKRASIAIQQEKISNLNMMSQGAYALANLSAALGNRKLAKPLAMAGGLLNVAAAGMAMGPLGACVAAVGLFAAFCDNDDDGLGEYLQQMAEQIYFVRQDLFELKQFMHEFRKELYENLGASFGAVHNQLSYMTDIMQNNASKADYVAHRSQQGIDAILKQQHQDILAPAMGYGKTIARSRFQDLSLLSRVAQLLESSTSDYTNGAYLLEGTSVQIHQDIQKLLNLARNQRGPLFHYLFTNYPALSNPKFTIINPYPWNAAARAYINLRKTPEAQKHYDVTFEELEVILSQGTRFINAMQALQINAASMVQALLTEMKETIQNTINVLEYPKAMQNVLIQRDDTPPDSLRQLAPDTIPLNELTGFPPDGPGCNCSFCAKFIQLPYQNYLEFKDYLKSGRYSIPKVFLALEAIQLGQFTISPTTYSREFTDHHACYTRNGSDQIASQIVFFVYNIDSDFIQEKKHELPMNSASIITNLHSYCYVHQHDRYFTNRLHKSRQFTFSKKDETTATQVLSHYRKKTTTNLLQKMEQNLNTFRDERLKASSTLNIIIALLNIPEVICHSFPAFPFPESIIPNWIEHYKSDMAQQKDPFAALPLSLDVLPMLNTYMDKISAWESELMLHLPKLGSINAPHIPELTDVHLVMTHLYQLKNNAVNHLNAQRTEAMNLSRSVLNDIVQQIHEKNAAFNNLLSRMTPLEQTGKIETGHLEKFYRGTRLKKNEAKPLPEQQNTFKQRLQNEIGDFPLEKTLTSLKQAEVHFQSFSELDEAVLIAGTTGRGKSTLTNCLLGQKYVKGKNVYGTIAVPQLESGQEESSKTSQFSASETFLPQSFRFNDFYLIDMPGFEDSREEPETISHGASMIWLKSHIEKLKGIVIVCDESDLKPKFTALRHSFAAIGHAIKNMPPEIERQVCLVITKSGISPQEVLERLELWHAEEIRRPVSDNQQAVVRVLSLLIQSTSNLLVVDVTEPDTLLSLVQKIQSMPSHSIQPFSFIPATHEIKLFTKIIQAIVKTEEAMQQDVVQRQSGLMTRFKQEIEHLRFPQPLVAKLEEQLQRLNACLEQCNDQEVVFDKLQDLIRALEAQKDYLVTGNLACDAFEAFLTELDDGNTWFNNGADEERMVEELLGMYNELQSRQLFFDAIKQIARHLDGVNPPRNVAMGMQLNAPTFFNARKVGAGQGVANDEHSDSLSFG